MAYDNFTDNKPNAGTDTVPAAVDYMRANSMALRDSFVSGMGLPGWSYSHAGGTSDQPTTLLWSKGAERLRVQLTWGSSGGADGNVTLAALEYSADSGSTFQPVGAKTISYSSDGTVSTASW